MRCPVCGDAARLRVLAYRAPQDEMGALVRYECLECGVIAEHWSYPMSDVELGRYGYSATPAP